LRQGLRKAPIRDHLSGLDPCRKNGEPARAWEPFPGACKSRRRQHRSSELTVATKDLSPREKEIVELCVEGLTNEAIAHRLGLSVGTVNTYWLRIKLKVGGTGRTDTVVRIIKDRAELALRENNVERKGLAEM